MTKKDEGCGIEHCKNATEKLGIGHEPAADVTKDGTRLPLSGQNELTAGETMIKREKLTENPMLMAEWDYEKNGDLRPEDFTSSSRRFVWWTCAYGHSWQARIKDRTNGASCPYDCVKRKPDFTPLASVRADLAAEWDYKRNDFLSPQDVHAYSNIKAKWRCNEGHSWTATVAARQRGIVCPHCLKERLENGQ